MGMELRDGGWHISSPLGLVWFRRSEIIICLLSMEWIIQLPLFNYAGRKLLALKIPLNCTLKSIHYHPLFRILQTIFSRSGRV
mgnify:CR=1 FL=1